MNVVKGGSRRTLVDRILDRTERWLVRLDRERDLVMRQIAHEGRAAHLLTWLDRLDAERSTHVALMARMEILRSEHHPALLFASRPVHATLKPVRSRKVAS